MGPADCKGVTGKGLVLQLDSAWQGGPIRLPRLPLLLEGGGFAIEFWIYPGSHAEEGEPIVDSGGRSRKGIALEWSARGTIRLLLNDGKHEASWECDEGLLQGNQWHHVAVIVDGGPKIVTFVVNGQLCDGGAQRPFGWGRFTPYLNDVNGVESAWIGSGRSARIGTLRIYDRYLLTSEAVSNFRSGPDAARGEVVE